MKAYAISQLSAKMVSLQSEWSSIITSYNNAVQQAYADGNKNNKADEIEHLALKKVEPIGAKINAISAQLSTIDKVFGGLEAQLSTYEAKFNAKNFTGSIKPTGGSSGGSGSGGSGGSGGGDSSKTDKDIEDLVLKIDRFKDLNSQIEQITNEIEKNRALQKTASDEQLKELIEQEKQLLEKQKQAHGNLRDELKKEQNEIGNILSQNGFTFDISGNISNYKEGLKKLENWANESTGDEKERRQELVKDLSDQVDRYYDLINDEISDTDKTIINTSNEIYEIIMNQELEKIEAIKDASDAMFDEIERMMNKLDYQQNVDGTGNADKVNDYYVKKLGLIREQISQAEKDLESYNKELNSAITADAKSEALANIQDMEDTLLSYKDTLQSMREEYQTWLIEIIETPYNDKMWQLGTQQMNKIEYKLEILDEDDTVGKMGLLEEKLSIQQQMVDETNKYYQQLAYTRDNVELTADAYQELIQKMMNAEETMHSQSMSLQQLKEQMEELAKESIEAYINQLKELEKLQMEQRHQEKTNALGSTFFKVSEEEYNKYKKIKSDAINSEINSLKAKLKLDSDNLALQQQLKGLQIELYDLQNGNYSDIQDWYELSENIHNANIEAIEKELEALEEADELEKEREERLEKQNALLEAQQKIEEIKRNKNIRQMKKDENGEWNFEYTYDEKELADANKDYQEKIEDLTKWEEELEKDKYKKKLEEQKKYEQEALDTLKEMYDKQLAELEKKHDAEKEALEDKYDAMLKNTEEYLDELKTLYGDNWSKIMTVLDEELAKGEAEVSNFKNHTIDEANEATNALNALMKYINEIDGTTITIYQRIVTIRDSESSTPSIASIDNSGIATASNMRSVGDTNTYNVQASFPNATDSSEIERALMNLDTIAKQKTKTK